MAPGLTGRVIVRAWLSYKPTVELAAAEHKPRLAHIITVNPIQREGDEV